ncbi:hypothetical protein ACH5RR_004224 [Cinchona calisaya]|uniref:Uncharacterized protein n=1 Tax=Cinchona calisaya TaxID=153742 RepID=A0ABD3AX02_9GENT
MDMRIWPRRSVSTKTIYLGRPYNHKELEETSPKLSNCNDNARSKKQSWKGLWRKLLKEKRKIFEPPVHVKFPYDAQSYTQNFDDGHMLDDDDEEEPGNDLLSRSFSMRFADPSKLFREKDVGM